MWKYSYFILVNVGVDYTMEPLEKSMARLSRCGYNGVELVGEPAKVDTREIIRLLKKYHLEASSVTPIYTSERDLISTAEKIRQNAVNYAKRCVDMAKEIGAPVVGMGPCSACMKITPQAPFEKEWRLAIESLRATGEYAAKQGIKLVVEPWNRYETYFINRLDQALDLVKAVNLNNVGVMGDFFHMNIEETSLPDAILKAGAKLMHVHAADSNRAAPGKGHINFNPIYQALKKIDYQNYVTMELLPAAADPFAAMKIKKADEFYDQYSKESIDFLKKLENSGG